MENWAVREKKLLSQRNVVLVGPVGSGKSTFGNYLTSFGQIQYFKTSASVSSCTKNILSNCFNANGIDINVIDTPGMGDEEDVHNMEMLLRMVNDLRQISAVVICINYSQRDDTYGSFGPTIKYYCDLFKPVFTRGNVILLITQVDADNYIDWVSDGEFTEALKEVKQEKLKRVQETTQTEIPLVEIINSKISKQKLENIQHSIKSGKFKDNIYTASYFARERIIKFISSMEPVSMNSHLLPLPPKLESLRINNLNILNEQVNRLRYVGGIKSKETQTNIEKLKAYGVELNRLVDALRHETAKLDALKDKTMSQMQYFKGDEFIHIGRKEDNYFFLKHKDYVHRVTSWNCNVDWKGVKTKSESEGGGKDGPMVLYFDVVPDFVNVTRSEMKPSEFYRWFCVVRLEYDGQIINADAIIETSTKIRMLKLEEKELTHKIEDLNRDITDVGLEAAGVASQLQKLEQKKSTISRENFWLNEISDVVAVLNDPGLLSLKSSF